MSFTSTLFGLESGGQNIANTTATTSSGQAQGYFQITTGTWNTYAGKAGVDLNQYPTPLSAPLNVQSQVASTIPLGQWAGSTLSGLQAAGYSVDPTATLGQNAANNNDPFFTSTGGSQTATPSTAGTDWLVPPIPSIGFPGISGLFGSGSNSILGTITDWVERGFLIIVGLVIVVFGLWHLAGRPNIGRLTNPETYIS
jgi:hypothetical protein